MNNKILKLDAHYKGRRNVFMCKTLKMIQGKSPTQLLEMFNVKLEAPIDLNKLLKEMGVPSISVDFSEVEEKMGYNPGDIVGATLVNEDEIGIFFRTGCSENRRRFTIAHELAHCCLHTDDLKETHIELRQLSEQDKDKEYYANVFAGELLIPYSILKKYYDDMLVPSLSSLTEIFKVSSSVMAARLDYLNLSYYKDLEICEV